jgi:arsenite methyltransferase
VTTNAKFWDDIAERYAAKPVDDPDAFDRKIAITKAHMKPGDVVLDIGCGTGSLALRLAETGAHVHGLDVSSEMVRIARSKAAADAAENVTFHEGPFDETFTTFADESLDGICAYSIIHLVEDRPAMLERIFRLLKPGGFLVSSTLCLRESWVPMAPMITVMRWLGKAPYVGVFSRRALETDIEQAGFVDLDAPDVGAQRTVVFLVAKKPLR